MLPLKKLAALQLIIPRGRQAPKVEIDYVQRKELRKPPKAKPGFVIYHTNYSMMCVPNIDGIEIVE